jgi:hypothetical protein
MTDAGRRTNNLCEPRFSNKSCCLYYAYFSPLIISLGMNNGLRVGWAEDVSYNHFS